MDMWQKVGEKKNWIMRTACILLIVVLISIQLICGVYARFAVGGTGTDSARTASFAFETKDKDSSRYLNLSNIKNPGDQEVYTFTVSNQKDGKVSEVAEKYRFTLQINGSMPLVCTISGEDGSTILEGNISDATPKLPLVVEADGGQFAASAAETDTYTLTVCWPQEANDARYASGSAVAEVLLNITAEQID